ncbi:MAG: exodeoxyribonuclease VII small subunit [Patescibacteria group bacterium]|jgi:exodeoxyribonuclease VII small subunit
MSLDKENISYDKAMQELKMIVGQLQEEAVSIDDLSNKAKRAAELISYCREKLRSTEGDLKSLFEE